MALQHNVTTASGIEINNAYSRVESIQLLNKSEIQFSLRSYVNSDLPFFMEIPFTCAYDIAGDNPIKQAYEHLKTLPEFAGAADV